MEQKCAEVTVPIRAPAAKVWEALTDPKLIKKYFFGVDVTTDWKVGSPIVYRGIWEGKAFEDKGTILQVEPGKLLVSSYWSSFSGLPDRPENYQEVAYRLTPQNGETLVAVTQNKIPSEHSKQHCEQNWKTVLGGLKKLLEG